MKVGLYLENKNISDVDLSKPEEGNPGIGGTQFNFITLPVYFNKQYPGKAQFTIYANTVKNLPDSIKCKKVENCIDGAKNAAKDKCDFFIWRPTTDVEGKIFTKKLDSFNIPIIAWVHNTPSDIHMLDKMAYSKYLKRFVCVSQEQLDRLRDHPIFYKSVCIFNGFDYTNYVPKRNVVKAGNKVVYLGSLVPAKGFQLLAKNWKSIKSQVPSAKLVVIGSGRLYNRNQKLGMWGIAEENYENSWRKYLMDKQGERDKSVIFKGTLGIEKIDILQEADVGVVNPSGKTENCPGAAIEFQASGVPVVSGAYRGLLDTVVHNKTGLLGKSENDLIDNIVYLLKNPVEAEYLGKNGIKFIQGKFSYSVICKDWLELFKSVKNDEKVKTNYIKQFPFSNFKIIREFIRVIKIFVPFIPSIRRIRRYLGRS